MTKEEATKYLIKPICTSTIESKEYRKQLEAYTTAVESLNCGEERRMKEYIVHPPKNNLLVIEEYSTFYGEPVKELIRCKDCKFRRVKDGIWMCGNRMSLMMIHAESYCSYGVREEE